MRRRFTGKDKRSILCPRDSRCRKNISTVPNSGIDYGPGIQASKRPPAKCEMRWLSGSELRSNQQRIRSLSRYFVKPFLRYNDNGPGKLQAADGGFLTG